MLYRTINQNREAIATRVRERRATRAQGCVGTAELEEGIILFLSKLSDLLFLRHADSSRSDVEERREIAQVGGEHGRRLYVQGFSAAHAVHDFGDVGRTLTEIAERLGVTFSGEDYETLSLCIDAAVAGAVTEHARAHDRARREAAVGSLPPAAVWERMATPAPSQRPGKWADGPAGNRTESGGR